MKKMPAILRLDRAISRSEWFGFVMVPTYALLGLAFWWLDQPTYACISFGGLLYELNQMEIRKLRAEVRRKRMWNEGN